MQMIATVDLRYASKDLKSGEMFDATPTDADILMKIGKARQPDEVKPSASLESRELKSDESGDLLDPAQKPPRRYNRRDLRAKD